MAKKQKTHSSTPSSTPSPLPADTTTETTTPESTEEDEAARKAAKVARKAEKKAAKAKAREQQEREAKQDADKQQETSTTTITETDDDAAARKAAKKAAKRAAKEAAAKATTTTTTTTTTTETSDETMEEEETKEPPRIVYKHDASKKSTGKIQKNFYKEAASLTSMTEAEVAAYRTKHQMQVDHEIKPMTAFTQLEGNIPKNLLKWLLSTYQTPTPIQAQCWPALLSGHDVVGIAETGSGKTLGFVVPAIVHIIAQPAITTSSRGPIVLILSPTRELAMQTADVCEKAGSQCSLSSICIYGGVDKYQQIGMLKKGVHFVVATPGRLLALINEKHCTLARVTYLILDEADRMLDMGFEPDIRAILAHISTDRQTLMFSATWPDQIQKLAHEFITNPVHITIGKPNNELTTNSRITQSVEVIDDFARDKRLVELLNQYHKSRKNRVLIFVLYKKEVPRLERMLQTRGFAVRGISGDKNQSDRTQALAEFKSGLQPLLIATDVAARGLDIPNVEYVINYSFPLTIEDYVHRIGRTGRGGATGVSHTFFTKNDKHLSGEFINLLNEAKVTVPPELLKFGTGVKRKEHSMYGAHFKADDDRPMKKATRMVF